MENVIKEGDMWLPKDQKELLDKYIFENKKDIDYRLWCIELIAMCIKDSSKPDVHKKRKRSRFVNSKQ
jgi:hypothetical protein